MESPQGRWPNGTLGNEVVSRKLDPCKSVRKAKYISQVPLISRPTQVVPTEFEPNPNGTAQAYVVVLLRFRETSGRLGDGYHGGGYLAHTQRESIFLKQPHLMINNEENN